MRVRHSTVNTDCRIAAPPEAIREHRPSQHRAFPGELSRLLTSRPVGAREAQSFGIVSDIAGDEGVLAAARAAAGGLAARPAHALGAARKLVRSSWGSSLEEHLDREAATIARSSAAEETAALISGFLNQG